MADLITMLQAAAGQVGGEYQISRSLRFNSADSAYLSRTPASASNRKTFTISFWVKRSALGATQYIAEGGSPDGATTRLMVRFLSTDTLAISNGSSNFFVSSAVYRDVSAWYHIVVAFDTPNATEANRYKIYVNGSQITGTDNYPSINADTGWNMAQAHSIGRSHIDAGSYFNGYITEFYNIDGQALTPSSFGETNATTGVWSPIRYAGTYGTNGFYLNFSDNTSTTTLGEDQAGSNDWTLNNFSVTAGAGNDSLVDVPTRNTEDVDTGAGGEVRGNYATLNPLRSKNSPTFSQGNMRVTDTTPAFGITITTIPPVSGDKIYGEATVASNTSGASVVGFGFTDVASGATFPDPGNANLYIFYGNANGNIYNGASLVTSGLGAPTAGTVLQVAYDKSNGYAWVGKANTWYDSTGGSTGDPSAGTNPTFTLTSNNLNFYVLVYSNSLDINFGQRPFAYTAPSGFKALVTTNLPDPTVVQGDDYFNTVLYTGTGSSLGVTGVGFQPDWVWIKERSGAADHGLYDAVRGVQKQLESNTTTAETTEATGLTAFGTDGFTVGALAQLNTSADTYVAWKWKANGAGVSNTDGTISSTVSVSTDSGFSIVEYTKLADGNSVGHGLGVTPAFIIQKITSGTGGWLALHQNMNAGGLTSGYLLLNTTDAFASNANVFTAVTSTTFTVGSVISNADQIVYCFAEVEGFSKFGSYTGNGSADGPFVYTGFRPAWVMIKRSSAVNNWVIQDTSRSVYNVSQNNIYADSSGAEASYVSELTDILSNGFKQRGTGISMNGSGSTYIYMAFAENPFKYSLAR